MNNVSVSPNVLKLQVGQNAGNLMAPTVKTVTIPKTIGLAISSNSISVVNGGLRDTNSNFTRLKYDKKEMSFKADYLQLLTTRAMPPYIPVAPPSFLNVPNFKFYPCVDCGDSFALESSLNFHLQRRSVLIQFPCESCKVHQAFYNRCALLSHIRAHSDKNEPSDIGKAVVNPLPRVLMDGLQTEIVNSLDDELNSMDDVDQTLPTEFLEFSLKEIEDEAIIVKESSICPSNVSKLKCVDCNEVFENTEARRKHLVNDNKIPVLVNQCNTCGMFCPSKCYLKAHQRLHLQVSPYVCPECGESPDFYWATFQHHVKFKCFHNARSIGYKCPICKRVSPSKESLLKHMELHTEKYLKCTTCPRAYSSTATFEEHFEEYHIGMRTQYNTIYKCSLCDIVFLDHEQMLQHRATHLTDLTCEYVFNCMQCGKALETKLLLLVHIKAAHPKLYKNIKQEHPENKPAAPNITYRGKVECILCNCNFHSYQGYTVHVSRAHINVNQPCSYCYMIIGNRREMVIHGKKHLKKGNVVCLLCNNKKCHDEKSLDLHLSKHVEKLQYCSGCPICNELMPTLHEALKHLRMEHFLIARDPASNTNQDFKPPPSEKVSCHFCRISFDTDIDLQTHLKTKHSVDQHKPENIFLASEETETPPAKKLCVPEKVCAKCDFQSAERDAFKQHLLSHQINKDTYQCQECGLCFVVEPALIKHLRIIHKIVDPKKYIEEEGTNFMPDSKKTTEVYSCDSLICSVCFTTFPSETSLKTHMRSHGMAFIQANKINSGN